MPFTDDDRAVISFLRLNKKYSAKRLLREFPDRGWSISGLGRMLRKIDTTGSTERRPGSGRSRSGRTLENIERVKQALQEHPSLKEEGGKDCKRRQNSGGGPVDKRSHREIARKLGMSKTCVSSIIKNDLGLRCLKRRPIVDMNETQSKARLECAKQLLSTCPTSTVSFVWFTDRRLFTVATPSHTQHDRIYAAATPREKKPGVAKPRDKGLLVCVGISNLGRTGIHFLQPGMKIDGAYYRDVLLAQHLLPDIRETCPDDIPCLFQHDGAPVHRARETIQMLRAEAVEVVQTPANSGDLNPLGYRVWNALQESVYRTPVCDVADLRHRLWCAWHQLDQDVIDTAIEQWRVRLAACVATRGKLFEKKLSGNRLKLPPNDHESFPVCITALGKNESGTRKRHTAPNMDCNRSLNMQIVSTAKDDRSDCLPDIGPDNPCHIIAGSQMDKLLATGGPSWLESLTSTMPSTISFMETSGTGTTAAAALSGGSGNGSSTNNQTIGYPNLSGGVPSRGASLSVAHHGGQHHSFQPPYQSHHVDELSYLGLQPRFL